MDNGPVVITNKSISEEYTDVSIESLLRLAAWDLKHTLSADYLILLLERKDKTKYLFLCLRAYILMSEVTPKSKAQT